MPPSCGRTARAARRPRAGRRLAEVLDPVSQSHHRTSVISGPRSKGLRSAAPAWPRRRSPPRRRRRGTASGRISRGAIGSCRGRRRRRARPRAAGGGVLVDGGPAGEHDAQEPPGAVDPEEGAGAKTVRPSGPAEGIRVRSSVPSGPAISSAVPPWPAIDPAISDGSRPTARWSAARRRPGAGRGLADHRGRGDDLVALLVHLEAELHARAPPTHNDPRSMRLSRPSTSSTSRGPWARSASRSGVASAPGSPSASSASRVDGRRRPRGSAGLVETARCFFLRKMLTARCVLVVTGVVVGRPRSGGPKPPVDPCQSPPERSPEANRCRRSPRAGTPGRRSGRSGRRAHGERLARVEVDEVDEDLPPVAGVDRAGGVDDGHAVPRGEPRAGVHEAHEPGGSASASPVGTSARSPGPSVTSATLERSAPASPSVA